MIPFSEFSLKKHQLNCLDINCGICLFLQCEATMSLLSFFIIVFLAQLYRVCPHVDMGWLVVMDEVGRDCARTHIP